MSSGDSRHVNDFQRSMSSETLMIDNAFSAMKKARKAVQSLLYSCEGSTSNITCHWHSRSKLN